MFSKVWVDYSSAAGSSSLSFLGFLGPFLPFSVVLPNHVCVSGVFHQMSRNELKKAIEDNGGKVSSSISKKTNFIIAGDNMGPSKLTKAKDLGIPIISEQDFIDKIS